MENALTFTDGKPTYNAKADDQMQVYMQAVNAAAKIDSELIAKQIAYYELMEAYVASLRQTQASLKVVQDNLNEPASIDAQARYLLGTALGLRDAFYEYKAAR